MQLDDFVRALARMPGEDLRLRAKELRFSEASEEITIWRSMVAVDRVLKRHHRQVAAAAASRRAGDAVVTAAQRAALSPDDPDVVMVARSAAQIARGLVAEAAVQRSFVYVPTTWRDGGGLR